MKAKLTKDFKEDTQICELSPKRDSMGLYFQIHLMGHEILGKNYYLERSNWESFMITYTLRGHTNVMVDGTFNLASAGTFIFLDCELPHISWVDEPKDPTDASCEHFYIHLYPTDALRNLYSSITQHGNIISLNKDLGFMEMVKTLIEKYNNGTYNEAEASSMVYSFLLELYEESKKISAENQMPNVIKDALYFIVNNYKDKLTIKQIADYVSFAPNYLEFLFQKHLKTPINKYIQHYRFQKASDLLLTTNMSISDVAVAVGLTDSQALIRLFKTKANITPKQYRIINRSNNPN